MEIFRRRAKRKTIELNSQKFEIYFKSWLRAKGINLEELSAKEVAKYLKKYRYSLNFAKNLDKMKLSNTK